MQPSHEKSFTLLHATFVHKASGFVLKPAARSPFTSNFVSPRTVAVLEDREVVLDIRVPTQVGEASGDVTKAHISRYRGRSGGVKCWGDSLGVTGGGLAVMLDIHIKKSTEHPPLRVRLQELSHRRGEWATIDRLLAQYVHPGLERCLDLFGRR